MTSDLRRIIGDPELVRARFDRMPFMAAFFEGPEFRLVAANETYREFLGVADPIGLTVPEVFPEVARQRLVEPITRALDGGEPVTLRGWRVQAGPDQQERVLDIVIEPYVDGAVRGFAGYAFDVTADKRREEKESRQAAEMRTRYERARDVVAELQAVLLLTELPVLPQVRLAARYLVAAEDQAAGGDWFDAIPCPDGHVVLVVGDVVGHGVAASAAMGQLRAVLMQLVHTNDDLLAVLHQLDAFAARVRALKAATLALVRLDPATGAFLYSLCGHPPPLLIRADGETEYLPGATSGPLGVGREPLLHKGQLDVDELVLLYSDGLLERPHRTLTASTAELAAVAADAAMNRVLPKGAAHSPAERVCQLTVELLTRTGYRDDVTALAVQRLPEPAFPLRLNLTTAAGQLHVAREAMHVWLRGINCAPHDHDVLQLAVCEAITNAIDHAYSGPGPVRVVGELRPDGICEFRVTDHGRWRPPSPVTRRGRGLMMCERLLDEVTVSHPPQPVGDPPGSRGTTVRLRHRVFQPAMLASGGTVPNGHVQHPFHYERNDDVLCVSGTIDTTNADEFARALATTSRGGVAETTVDLTGVTHLASAGVRVLYEFIEQLAAHRHVPRLVTPPGSPAALVLDVVDLPHAPP